MFVTIINDCNDANAAARLTTRNSVLFNAPVNFVGINNGYDEFQAASILVDTLDAAQGESGIIQLNVAPRHGKGKHWKNGTPFGYFYYKQTLILATVDGFSLALANKLGIINNFRVLDIPTVIEHAINSGLFPKSQKSKVIDTQFRSYDFLPYAAKWVSDDIKIPSSPYTINENLALKNYILFVDNFGNCKTSILANELDLNTKQEFEVNSHKLKYYPRLKDVPDNTAAIITGSSGLEQERFLEIVIQGKSAAAEFGFKPGDELTIK